MNEKRRTGKERAVLDEDIRWVQRLEHFHKALRQLGEGVELAGQRELSPLEEQGLIQAFEFTHELAWNMLKDFLDSRGTVRLFGSKDVTREAFKRGLLVNGETWMGMIKSRNLTSHTYSESLAKQIAGRIIQEYFQEFLQLARTMERIQEDGAP